MEQITKTLLLLHIIAGFSSLILFWIPIITRKGGKNHIQIGKLYVKLMWIVVSTAAILSIKNLIIGKTIMAAFLGFLTLITANPLWQGIAILKNKKGISQRHRNIQLILHLAIVTCGVALIVYGIALKGSGAAILMFIFGGLGLSDLPNVIKAFKKSQQKVDWLKEHLVSMCISGIAAYTAFLVFGARQFLEGYVQGYWSIIPWIAPTLIGTVGIRYAVSFYKKKKIINA